MRNVSVVILNWQRGENVQQICSALRDTPNELIVWNNNPDPISIPGATVINSRCNFGVLSRYAVSLLAKSECVLIQDDDLLLPESTIHNLYEMWQQYPDSIHGLYGRNPRADGTYAEFRDHDDERAEIVCGRVMMFSRSLLSDFFIALNSATIRHLRFFKFSKDITNHIDDIIFSYAVMRATGVKNWVHNLERFELPDQCAISSAEDHYVFRQEAMICCREMFGIPKRRI